MMLDLKVGETTEIKGSGKKPYIIKNVDNLIWSCSCPAWRNQSGGPVRTCKHLKKLRGEDVEMLRVGQEQAIAEQKPKLRPDEKAKLNGPPLLLAHSWDGLTNPKGYFLSEKLDGVRAFYKNGKFISRQGNVFPAPEWFIKGLENETLDGELWLARKKFSETISIVKTASNALNDSWNQITYCIFDAPEQPGPFEDRIKYCRNLLEKFPQKHIRVLDQTICKSVEHLKEMLKSVESLGGEGLMLREPGSLYEEGRSNTLLKVKSFFDIEAEVTGYVPGKGKYKGLTGGLECKLLNGVEFKVGSGLSDEERRNPTLVGSLITIRYQELSKDGVPRFPVFVAKRDYE